MSENPGKELARVGAYGRATLNEKQQYAQAIASAGDLVPKTFWTKPQNVNGVMVPPRPNPGAVLYMLETAAMLGVHPMVGLTNIHIIEGKPSLSANLQAALVREAGHRLRVRVEGQGENTVAIAQIVRSDDPDFTFEVRWGIEEARAAQVLSKDNWKKYFRAMLKARAITECIREACPEVLMGATYSPDELGAVTDEQGEPINLEPVPEHPSVAQEGKEAPVTEPPSQVGTDEDFDWGAAVANASSREEVQELFRKGRSLGVLGKKIMVGDAERTLGDVLVEIGTAFREAEEASEPVVATIEEDGSGDAPAVLDPDVVDAEVVEESKPARKTRAKAQPEGGEG